MGFGKAFAIDSKPEDLPQMDYTSVSRKGRLTLSSMKQIVFMGFVCSMACYATAQNSTDSLNSDIRALHQVVVEGHRTPINVAVTHPQQEMDREQMEQLGVTSIADAAKRFAGTNVRDYGGIGGMKTVSVRNIGAHHTAVSYDGICMSNTQAGQIDVGRLSLDNVQTLAFSIGHHSDYMQSARHLASAGILSIETERPVFKNGRPWALRTHVSGGSFGMVNPSLRYYQQVGGSTLLSLDANYTHADGAYPFTLVNGARRTREYRNNSNINAFHTEANIYQTFADSSTLNVKAYWFHSNRGLPGAVILYNNISRERLHDEDFFTQAIWKKPLSKRLQLHTRLKYTHSWSLYEDTDVKYAGGHNEEINRQDEYYASATLGWEPFSGLQFSVAEDLSVNTLRSNVIQGNNLLPLSPRRFTSLTALTANYSWWRLKVYATLLGTFATEHVKNGTNPEDKRRLSPSVAMNFRLLQNEPLYVRVMMKNTFRMPSFNDLYYLRMGNHGLRPERACEWNAGLTWFHGSRGFIRSISLTADAYYNNVKDKIVAFPGTYVWKMANFGKVRMRGVDITAATEAVLFKRTSLLIQATYTYQKTEDELKKSASYGRQLPYTPQHSGNGSVLLRLPWFNVGYTVLMQGERWSMAQNTPQYRLEPYWEQSITLSRDIQLNKTSLHIQASLQNLTDEQYEIIRYYPMPGRHFVASATMTL